MNSKFPYLNDTKFLGIIDRLQVKEQHAKITVLSFNEKPIQNIIGKITGGNINLNGQSVVRRTCNLSMITDEDKNDITEVRNLLSINKKIELMIGFTNTTDQYTDHSIIWFPQGIYVITNPSISNSTSGINISLQLKDKMCLLNGECGGTLPASTRFDEYEVINDSGNYIVQKPTINQILMEVVHHFGGEQQAKIIISDIPDRIKQVVKWTGSKPLYIINTGGGSYTADTNEDQIRGYGNKDTINNGNFELDALIPVGTYKVYKNGDNVGYVYTDFVYNNELTFDGGSTVCDVLEAIKSYLGNFEYFYDIEGNFRFQEIKNYLNVSQSTLEAKKFQKITDISNSDYLINFTNTKSVYSFDDSTLVTGYTNAPQYSMIKNDFIVWGKKKNAAGLELPIRYHLAIDEKIEEDFSYDDAYYYTDPDTGNIGIRFPTDCDIYDSNNNLIDGRPKIGSVDYYYKYNDTVYFWDSKTKTYEILPSTNHKQSFPQYIDWRYKLYLSTAKAFAMGQQEEYQAELIYEFPKIFDVTKDEYFNNIDGAALDYWLDFIDTNAPIMELSIKNIGKRSKVVVDDKINCLFEPAIPDVVYIKNVDPSDTMGQQLNKELKYEAEQNGAVWSAVSDSIYSAFSFGTTFNAAYDLVRSLLCNYTSYNESISLQALPIYYLEPNTRITVNDSKSGINGDYIINSISLPLDITSTMSISCVRALERL